VADVQLLPTANGSQWPRVHEAAGLRLVLQAVALTADVDTDREVEQAVDDGGSSELVTEDLAPLAVGLVRGDDDAALRVALGDKLEEEADGDRVQRPSMVRQPAEAPTAPCASFPSCSRRAATICGVRSQCGVA